MIYKKWKAEEAAVDRPSKSKEGRRIRGQSAGRLINLLEKRKAEEAAVNRPSDRKPGEAVVNRWVDQSIY